MSRSRWRTWFRYSWLLALPILTLWLIWSAGTVNRFTELGLRQLGDKRLGGMTLQKAGNMQFRFMAQSAKLELKKSLSLLPDDNFQQIHLFVNEADLRKLNSKLPGSGRHYVRAQIVDGNNLLSVKVKYRGDFATHWGFFKKSWRIKTKKGNLFEGLRTFNLITPKSSFLYGNHLGYEMARMLGVLAPRSEMVTLNLNGKYQGSYLLVEQLSETTLRNSGRLPGDIYSGDERYGKDIWHGLDTDLFNSPGLWEKSAINNHYPENHREPLTRLLAALTTSNNDELLKLLDLEAFARFDLLLQLSNSQHVDDSHNWRLYFDPGRGRFYPIAWDIMPWASFWLPEDNITRWLPPTSLSSSHFMSRLAELPAYLSVKNKVITNFLLSGKPNQLRLMIAAINKDIAPLIDKDAAIMSADSRMISHFEAHRLAQQNQIVVDKILAVLQEHYLPGKPVLKASEPPDTLVWQGEININKTRMIDQPLIIKAGTTIRLAAGVSLFIHNYLSVKGTHQQPVIIEPLSSIPFGALVIEGQKANGSSIDGLVMHGGSGARSELREYTGMLSIHDVQGVTLNNCTLSGNQKFDDMLHAVYSSLTISQCRFENSHLDAVDLDISEASIDNTSFSNSRNDALDLMTSIVKITDSKFSNNTDKGISAGERSEVTVADSQFIGNTIALQIKDDSVLAGNVLEFSNNGTAADAYRKNWQYDKGGFGLLCSSRFNDNSVILNADKHSRLSTRQVLCDKFITTDSSNTLNKLKMALEAR